MWLKLSNIVRVEKNTNFVVMNKTALQDKRLSWKAKGLIAYMLSMPDDWQFYIDELTKHSSDGKSSTRSGFKELTDLGYVNRVREQKEDGKFEWTTIVYEAPLTDFPQVDKPSMDKPSMDNRTLLSNDVLSNELLSNNKQPDFDIREDQFKEWWNLYNNKKGRAKCLPRYKLKLKSYPHELIMAGTEKYFDHRKSLAAKGEFVPNQMNPYTFLNGEHFNDEYESQEVTMNANKYKSFGGETF